MPAPPVSALNGISKITPQLLSDVRNQFLTDVNSNGSLYYDEDIECIKSNDWQIQRFILENKYNQELALKGLTAAMRWRKSFGVKEINENDFPEEYYRSGSIITYGRDKNDAKIIIVRANIHKKVNEWSDIMKKFFIYQIEKIDFFNDGKGVTLILDCTAIGIGNLDLDLLQFIVTSFSSYYPKLFDAILIHELPYLLQYVFKLVQSWLPEDDQKFFHLTQKKNLNNFVSDQQLPDFMNGTNPDSYTIVPQNVVKAMDLVLRIGLKTKDAQKLKHLESYMK
ncbi:motile sperm domain-containing protein 2-like [Oppia nitens]|uniref:motile sperm domain-containing protein 2-like n=1 Tax=Oppia nitens TaxID=1686743 RepID=UPI0023DB00FC|nr:motile sperm domain-containing protein 2-like [Oppia nitens]